MKRINLFFIYLFFLSISAFSQLPPPEPPLPTGVSALQVGLTNAIFISWTPPISGLTGYKIYLTEGGFVRTILVEPRTTSTFVVTGLRLNTSYNVAIRSIRVNSPDTTQSTTGTTPILVPMIELVAPSITIEPQNITPTSIGVRITDSNASKNGFQIEYSTVDSTWTKTVVSNDTVLYNILSGLTPRTTYSIKVRAYHGTKFGPYSNILSRATLMDFPPAAILTSSGNCPTTVNLNWTIPNRTEDVQSQLLQLSFNNITFNTVKELLATDRSFVHMEALPGRNHFYRIVTVNTTRATPSNHLSVITKSFASPNPILNLISDQTNKSRNFLTFRWTNGAEERECNTNIRTEIVVEIKVNNEPSFKQYKRLNPFESSIRIEGLNPNDIIEVAVLSVSNKGLNSLKVFGKDTTAGPPYDPSNLIIVAAVDALNNRFFNLSWKDNSKFEDFFVIEKSIDKINYFPIGKIKFNITSFNDFDLEEGIIYHYQVMAGSNTEGNSKYSSAVFGLLDYSRIPNAPYALKGTVSGTKITLKWHDDASTEENYILEKSSNNGVTYAIIATLGRNITTFIDENTQTGKKYSYRVKAANPKGSSAFSNIEVVSIGMMGLSAALEFSNVYIYPNPTSDGISIALPDSQIGNVGNLKIIDKYNRIIISKEIKFENKDDFTLDLKGFPSGLYNVIISNNKETVSKKIFKN